MPEGSSPRSRRSAEERRTDVIRAATIEFARYGLHGASTVNIAERAGISQPYVLRLFSTKKQLFLETLAEARHVIESTWEAALRDVPANTPPTQQLWTLGNAFQSITGEDEVLRVLMQGFSAAADDDIRERCQTAMGGLFAWVREHTGASAAETQFFFAQGMMLMVGVAIGAPQVQDQEWARAFMLRDAGSSSE